VTQNAFRAQLAALTAQLAGRPLDAALAAWLNAEHGPGSDTYTGLKAACQQGVAEGWLCQREGGGIRYGRVFKPAPELHGFSVDVVDMTDIAGPHHTHPNGEIDLIMPLTPAAKFDGRGASRPTTRASTAAAAAGPSMPSWPASRRCTTGCGSACCRARRALPTSPRPAAPTRC